MNRPMRDAFGMSSIVCRSKPRRLRSFGLALLVFISACAKKVETPVVAERPSVLLITLDTTRADCIGPDARGVDTPSFNAIAARGLSFDFAYATVPQTLPSHTSMMSGLYPAGHGIHENARYVPAGTPLLAERLKSAGYRTAAFVSGFPLEHRFGLGRGFDLYDDEMTRGTVERPARETTDRALTWIAQKHDGPVFLWVHYFDPHAPYEPPEPYRTRYGRDLYRGEIAAMDEQLGRLVTAFARASGAHAAIIIAGDHGEGMGEHGEAGHGKMLYQGVMRVPLLIQGPGVSSGRYQQPVSTRRIFHTILDFAGLGSDNSLRTPSHEVVMGEAMEPFLEYGWQPQVMAVEDQQKAIRAGSIELYDVRADPAEQHDLAAQGQLSRGIRQGLRDYAIPVPGQTTPPTPLSTEDLKRLASLGYVSSGTTVVVRADAPRPRDMTSLFPLLAQSSELFVAERYKEAIPLLEKIMARDPHNLACALRLATAHSALGHTREALDAFESARKIAPDSADVKQYLALHYAHSGQLEKAAPLLEEALTRTPDWMPGLEALASIREKETRLDEALGLRQRILAAGNPSAIELIRTGDLAMTLGNTPVAIDCFERARTSDPSNFKRDLELGVLYLAEHRFDQARSALDRVPPEHPSYPMALFKRAQVSVLLHEPDQQARIDAATTHADSTTRALIEHEKLFARQ